MNYDEPLNIILLTIDCWRADHLGAMGATPSPTPNIDRLAAQGSVFTEAITSGGWTRPAMMALFSSLYASAHHGGSIDRLADESSLLSELLNRHGYMTAGFTTNPVCGRSGGFERGFDIFADLISDEPPELPTWAQRLPLSWAQQMMSHSFTHRFLRLIGVGERALPTELYVSGEQMTNQLLSWLSQFDHSSSTSPFFLWAHYMDMHWPYRGSRRHPISPDEAAQMWQDRFTMSKIIEKKNQLHPGRARLARWRTLYHEELTTIDEQIGRLLTSLQNNTNWQRTVVIITGDHGEEFYEHGRFGHAKNQLFDEGIHVPLIIRLPKKPDSQYVSQQVSLLDITPTLLALAGIPKPENMLGVSLLPLIEQGVLPAVAANTDTQPYPLSGSQVHIEMLGHDEYVRYRLAIRTATHKYIHDIDEPHNNHLYDRRTDPSEQRNLYDQADPISRHFDKLCFQHMAPLIAELRKMGKRKDSAHALRNVDPQIAARLQAMGYLP